MMQEAEPVDEVDHDVGEDLTGDNASDEKGAKKSSEDISVQLVEFIQEKEGKIEVNDDDEEAFEVEDNENRPQSSQEAGYETPNDETEYMSQVEKHESDDEDDASFDKAELKDASNVEQTTDEIAATESACKEFSQLYTEEEMQAVTNMNNTFALENRRLKSKLTKAKSQLETLTQKHNLVHDSLKAMEGQAAQQIERNSALHHELDEIRRNQAKIDKSEVTDILARVKVAGTGYTLLQDSSGKTVWHADQQIVRIQDQLYSEFKNVLQVVYE